MLTYLYTYLLSLPVIFAIDILWIGYLARDLYRTGLSAYIADPFNWYAGIIFYLLFVLGVMIFAVYPALATSNLKQALIMGALFGFMCYMTYDLTNLATVRNWPLTLSLIDMTWGTVLSIISTYIMYTVYQFLK